MFVRHYGMQNMDMKEKILRITRILSQKLLFLNRKKAVAFLLSNKNKDS